VSSQPRISSTAQPGGQGAAPGNAGLSSWFRSIVRHVGAACASGRNTAEIHHRPAFLTLDLDGIARMYTGAYRRIERRRPLALYREKDIFERRSAASEAKKALLERFKARPDPNDPEVLARRAERQAILEAREQRAREKERLRKEREAVEAAERARREAEAAERRRIEEERLAVEAKQREQEEIERIAAELALEAERKAKRDARYAARKSRKRGGRTV